MLRKKLKLDEQSSTSSPGCTNTSEFTVSQFVNVPKPKLHHAEEPSVKESQPPVKQSFGEKVDDIPYWQQVYGIELELSAALRKVNLPSEVAACYDPIVYAGEIHRAYMERFLDGPKPVLFIGMNPGPWGMCQTGVPFGYIPAVRDWMGLWGTVLKPEPELPARPVEGLACTREEQSGKRWWGLYQELCGSSDVFFRCCFVYNLCPLAFFHASGRNITPSELKGKAKADIQAITEQYLAVALTVLKPEVIVSVGRYTDDRIKSLRKQKQLDTSIITLCMPHPSPRSLNNTNWNQKAKVWLTQNGIMPYFRN